VRFPFRELPAASGGELTPRPVVWFCDPWPHPFGLAGLEGFLHHFIVTTRAYDGYLDIEPQS
jgi:hypothetical protein